MTRKAASKVFAVGLDGPAAAALEALFASVRVEVVLFRSFHNLLPHVSPQSRGCLLVNSDREPGDVASIVRTLCHRAVRLPVICLSESGDVPAAVRALKGGALDFLEAPVNDQVLIDAVNEAFEVDRATWHAQQYRAQLRQRFRTLTPREWDVVGPMVRGWSNRDIADGLGLSPKTIEVHRARILSKTASSSLTDLIRTAIRCDLLHEAAARSQSHQ
ncbi:LuxR C-terminal-related transcriptional regulator [Aquisalimonas sp.]|uniref:response regulator transcription factor n=1 Tax=Aquisalimonas sp. TaxID=1872621 RepID=UPI0025C10B73|nr:LuxR C-terminal-related transcriptional regulator [Aquisalimonas sp.]